MPTASELPPVMRLKNGTLVQHSEDWHARREEILQIALTAVCGARSADLLRP